MRIDLGWLVFDNGRKSKARAINNKAKILLEKEFNKFILQHEPDYFVPLVDFFKRYIDIKGKAVLEFGCGAGDLAFLLLEQGAQSALGIDIVDLSIQKARERVGHQSIKNAKFLCGDILKTQLPAGSADLVIAHSVFQYIVDDWQPILRKLYNTLSSDGTLIVTVETNASILKLIQTLNFYFLPEAIRSRFYLLFKIAQKGESRINDEIIKGKSRYLGIPPLSIKSNGELIIEFVKAGFSETRIINTPKLHKLSRPHLAVIARKRGSRWKL